MPVFGEYLYQQIQSRKVSISGLARDSGVERTALHKALKGDRILPYPAVEALAKSLKLSPEEIRKLRWYYDGLFESENRRQARDMVDRMFRRLWDLPDSIRYREHEPVAVSEEKAFYRGYGEIAGLVWSMVREETKRVRPRLELALPPDIPAVMQCVKRFYMERTDLEIEHIICFDTSGTEEENNLRNLEALGCLLPECVLSGGRYQTFYYYNDQGQHRYTDPLPYFLVTQGGAVCFAENCQTAIYLKGEEQAEYFRSCFYHLKQNCCKLVEYLQGGGWTQTFIPESYSDRAGTCDRNGNPGFCSIMVHPCMGKELLPGLITMFTRRGIAEFLNTGKLYDPAERVRKAVGPEMRRRILREFGIALRSDRIRGRMFNEMLFALPERFGMLTTAEEGAFLYDKSRELEIRLCEKKLSGAFHDWAMHLFSGECVFDRERTAEIVEGMAG